MSHDISFKDHRLTFSNQGFRVLDDILCKHGADGSIPWTDEGETVTKEVAIKVGEAMLRYYKSKVTNETTYPQLTPFESNCLAYALLLCVADGDARHF